MRMKKYFLKISLSLLVVFLLILTGIVWWIDAALHPKHMYIKHVVGQNRITYTIKNEPILIVEDNDLDGVIDYILDERQPKSIIEYKGNLSNNQAVLNQIKMNSCHQANLYLDKNSPSFVGTPLRYAVSFTYRWILGSRQLQFDYWK